MVYARHNRQSLSGELVKWASGQVVKPLWQVVSELQCFPLQIWYHMYKLNN